VAIKKKENIMFTITISDIIRRGTAGIKVLLIVMLLPVFLSFDPAAQTQTLQYDVIRNNKVIGVIKAVKRIHSGVTEFNVESDVNFDMLIDYHIYSIMHAAFSGEQLKESSLLRKVNGKEKTNTQIVWAQDRYLIRDKSSTVTFGEKIKFTTACLMNIEPLHATKIFSENFKQFIPVKEVKPHVYELSLPDGNRNIYKYENGICVWASVETTLSGATFKLKK
jgi:hypothetical protein